MLSLLGHVAAIGYVFGVGYWVHHGTVLRAVGHDYSALRSFEYSLTWPLGWALHRFSHKH